LPESGRCSVVIAEDKMIRDLANTVQNFLRFRTVSDNISQTNQDIGFQSSNIRENLLPGRQIAMDI